jgi:hypothetical protein
MVDACKHDNKVLDFLKYEEFIPELSKHCLFRESLRSMTSIIH